MKTPLKLSDIDKEHLQELYDASGVPREHLPYTTQFDAICLGFQDRTFKNADPEQVFGALLKYIRSGSAPAPAPIELKLDEEKLKQLKLLLPRHSTGGKILPYSDELESARREFTKASTIELDPADFWRAIVYLQSSKRRPPPRRKAVVKVEAEADGDDE